MYNALVVDDDPEICSLAVRALARNQIECKTAWDGEQALQACDRELFDAVVTDLRMPRRHGHSLAVELLQRNPRPKIVVLTGLAEPKLINDLIHRGIEEVVRKPANFNQLAQTVHRLVSTTSPQPAPELLTLQQLQQQVERPLVALSSLFADRLQGVFDLCEGLSDPPPAVTNFITRQMELEAEAEEDPNMLRRIDDSRQKARVRCHSTALAVPVDSDFMVVGDPFKVAVRDISESGARLLHTRSTNAKFLALSWNAETLPLQQIAIVGRVTRCRPLSPFYDIGCQFVMADG